mmetsp:Transcript_1304/g.3469  ORF Transcript_1304/g.3469 Transcript_1304/m.3469 type:complete len:596 (+) Transcript_1304:165-1952(+)
MDSSERVKRLYPFACRMYGEVDKYECSDAGVAVYALDDHWAYNTVVLKEVKFTEEKNHHVIRVASGTEMVVLHGASGLGAIGADAKRYLDLPTDGDKEVSVAKTIVPDGLSVFVAVSSPSSIKKMDTIMILFGDQRRQENLTFIAGRKAGEPSGSMYHLGDVFDCGQGRARDIVQTDRVVAVAGDELAFFSKDASQVLFTGFGRKRMFLMGGYKPSLLRNDHFLDYDGSTDTFFVAVTSQMNATELRDLLVDGRLPNRLRSSYMPENWEYEDYEFYMDEPDSLYIVALKLRDDLDMSCGFAAVTCFLVGTGDAARGCQPLHIRAGNGKVICVMRSENDEDLRVMRWDFSTGALERSWDSDLTGNDLPGDSKGSDKSPSLYRSETIFTGRFFVAERRVVDCEKEKVYYFPEDDPRGGSWPKLEESSLSFLAARTTAEGGHEIDFAGSTYDEENAVILRWTASADLNTQCVVSLAKSRMAGVWHADCISDAYLGPNYFLAYARHSVFVHDRDTMAELAEIVHPETDTNECWDHGPICVDPETLSFYITSDQVIPCSQYFGSRGEKTVSRCLVKRYDLVPDYQPKPTGKVYQILKRRR